MLMRKIDWSQTALGPPESWPQNLCSSLRLCLMSLFPITIGWGPQHKLFYNDPHIPLLGSAKHPAAIGRPAQEVWSEIWHIIGPMLDEVFETGKSTWLENVLFFFDREISREEVYVTLSYSPILGSNGKVEGIFCPCTETTQTVIGARRLETLRKLGISVAEAQSVAQACNASADVLAQNPHDIAFAAVYVVDEDRTHASLRASAGLPNNHMLPLNSSSNDCDRIWPLAQVLKNLSTEEINLEALRINLPGGLWPEPANKALIIPIIARTQESLGGLLVVGVSPRRVLDEQYRSFFELVARHIGAAIADAQAYEAERKRAEALAELDRAKTAFFSNVSHEFRTPLTLILGTLEEALSTLRKVSHVTETLVSPLMTAQRNALRLLKLVNSLLDFSRIEAGRAQASFEPTDISVLTREIASVFRSMIERAGIKFTIRCDHIAEPVYIDREMWEKVVLNLLSNAFKFTFAGKITVALKRTTSHIEFTVEDTGIGVAPEELPHLFERFYRIEGTKARTHEGSGIGLALVHELIKMHGGEIQVKSKLEKGTVFKVLLQLGASHLPRDKISVPLTLGSPATHVSAYVEEALRWCPDAVENNAVSSLITSNEHDDLSDAYILIVDDNTDMRDYLARLLTRRWKVKAVNDGQAALIAAKQEYFDLILTDVMMPQLDGFGLLKALRDDLALQSVPVIMLSARAGEDACIEGLEAGADDYLIKPFTAQELMAKVASHLKLSTRRQLVIENAALKRLHEVSTQLVSEGALSTLLQAVMDAAINVSDANKGILQLYDSESGAISIAAHRGFSQSFLDHFNLACDADVVSAEALRLGERVIIEDILQSPIFLNTPSMAFMREANVRAVQTTLMLSRHGKLLGIISTYWSEPHLPEQGTLRILDLLARHAADLIEHRQREHALYNAKEEAEKANRAKDIFLATLSHELRTPLSVILSWAQLLRIEKLDPDKIKIGIQSIEESCLAQNQLISDLLDISKIVMGKLSINLQNTDLVAVLDKTIDSIRPAAEKKGIKIKKTIKLSRVFVSADPVRLKQVFWNLLSNAIKFTPANGEIKIALNKIGNHVGSKVQIIIQDSGKGIKPEFIPHIFDQFNQADSSIIRTHGGLGLGLALVKNILELQGGSIAAYSQGEDKGATFTVTLSVIDAPLLNIIQEYLPSTTQSSHQVIDSQRLEKVRILFVDDEEKTREIFNVLLSSFGAIVEVVTSTHEALQRFQVLQPQVLISDIAMPGEDGYSLIRKIRQLESEISLKTFAIALTAFAGSEHQAMALSAGFQMYLTKPINIIQLVQIIATQITESMHIE
jgi:signal transduction histidine kinase/two-component SAPR family response regulator